MLPVEQPFKTYTGLDGKPINNGFVYFGQPDENPITSPVQVFWDAEGTIPALQPLRTKGGYIVRAGTPASVFYDGVYSQLVQDSKGLQVSYARNSENFSVATAVSKYTESLASPGGASLVGFKQKGAGALLRAVKDKLQESVSVKDFGAVGDGIADDTVAVLAAYTELQSRGGGVLEFPRGTYRFYLDVSRNTTFIKFRGNFSTFKPAPSGVRSQPVIIYCDNSAVPDGFQHSSTQFERCVFDAENAIDHCLRFISSCSDFDTCSFLQSKVAAFYGSYAQYCRFKDCVFASNTFDNNSHGCFLTGTDGAHRSNEVLFDRCQFFTNKNGLYIGGAEKVRIRDATFQDHQSGGTAALRLHTDLAGNSTRATDIVGCWFEINQIDAIVVNVAEGTNIERNFLVGTAAKPCNVKSTHSYDIRFVNNSQLSDAYVTFAHPAVNSDTASVTILGGNIWPTLNLDHPGPSYVNGQSAATNMVRKDSLLTTSGKVDSGFVPIVGVDNWFTATTNVSKGVPRNIFSLTQKPSQYPTYRVMNLTVDLWSWDDADASGQFGFSGHAQTFNVFASYADGIWRVTIPTSASSTDLGSNTAYQAPGNMQLTAVVNSDVITFQVQWPGIGSAAANMTAQTICCMIRGAGTNSFYLTRL